MYRQLDVLMYYVLVYGCANVLPAPLPCRLTSFRSCPAGSQLYLSYGPLANRHLLLFYGFVVPRNPFDTVELLLPQVMGSRAHDYRGLGLKSPGYRA